MYLSYIIAISYELPMILHRSISPALLLEISNSYLPNTKIKVQE